MATTPSTNNNKRKIWISIAIIVACVVIGLVIWRLVAGHV